MPLWTKKDFADKCGMPTNSLSTYIRRGKVKVKDDGMIDDKVAENKLFLEKNKGKQSEAQIVKELQKRNLILGNTDKSPHTDAFDKIMDVDLDDEEYADSENSKIPDISISTKHLKHHQAVKTASEVRLLKLKEQKLRGIVIPSELVKPLFFQHNVSLTTEFKNGAEDLLRLIGQKNGWTNDEKSEMKGKLINIINTAIQNANEATLKSVATIVDEYSIKKSVGERG